MDQNPQRNLPPTNNSYEPQYHWFSPLPDAQLDTFNPSPAPRPEDDPFPNMDPELFTGGIANTSSRTDLSTHTGYQPQHHWSNPLRDIQPGIFNPEPTPNPEDNPIFGIDPELFSERATHSSDKAGPSTYAGYQHQDIQIINQPSSWPTTSITGVNQSSNTTPLDNDTRWPTYRGQNTQNMEANMRTPSTNVAYPNTRDRLDPLQNEHGSTRQQTHCRSHVNQHTYDTTPGLSGF